MKFAAALPSLYTRCSKGKQKERNFFSLEKLLKRVLSVFVQTDAHTIARLVTSTVKRIIFSHHG
jgi:hypothetical protein